MKNRVIWLTVCCAMALAALLAPRYVAPLKAADDRSVQDFPVTPGALWVGSDPWITYHGGHYYSCNSMRGRIEVWKSSRMGERGQRAIVWRAPDTGWNCAEIWAPELHWINGKWYIYYAASAGANATHRMGVLQAQTEDPQGQYTDRGMLYTGDDPAARRDPRWAIDGTVLERGKDLFFIWSGWEDERDVQYLYIAPMSDPATVSGPRVKICPNDTYPWEHVGDDPSKRGLHEGPAFLQHAGKIFLVFSCSGSWQPTYKLGMLWAKENANLLAPDSWHKVNHPVFESTPDVFGVGHCSFPPLPDGRQEFIAYHSKVDRDEGWRRVIRIQRFRWTEDGFPDFGRPLETKPVPPSTQPTTATSR